MDNCNFHYQYPTYDDASSGMPWNDVPCAVQGTAQECGSQPWYSVVNYPEEVDFGQMQYPSRSLTQPIVQYEPTVQYERPSYNPRPSMMPVRNHPILHYSPRQSFYATPAQPAEVLNFPTVTQVMPNHGSQRRLNPTAAAVNQVMPVPNVRKVVVQLRPEGRPSQIFPEDSMHDVIMFKKKKHVYQQLNKNEMAEAVFDLYSAIYNSSPKKERTAKRIGRPKVGKAGKKSSVKKTPQTAKKDMAGSSQSFKATVPFRWYTASQSVNSLSKMCPVKKGKKEPEHRCLRSCDGDQNSTKMYDAEYKGSHGGENLNSLEENIHFTGHEYDDYGEENNDDSEEFEELDVMDNGVSAVDCTIPEQQLGGGPSSIYLED